MGSALEEKEQLGTPEHYGLALSGGGYRALLFHIGVVSFLRSSGDLPKVTHITSVSGGSIVAAHMIQNWGKYTSEDDAEFISALDDLYRLTRKDIRTKLTIGFAAWKLAEILTKAFPPTRFLTAPFTRHARLKAYYSSYLFSDEHGLLSFGRSRAKVQAADGRADNGTPAPYHYILATNMTHGGMCSFTPDGFSVDTNPLEPEWTPTVFGRANRISFSRAVACSSAFPGLLPSFPLRARELGVPTIAEDRCVHLNDGGIFDNLGVVKFEQLAKHGLFKPVLLAADCADIARLWVQIQGTRSVDQEVGNRIRAVGLSDLSEIKGNARQLGWIDAALHDPAFCLEDREFKPAWRELARDEKAAELRQELIGSPHPIRTYRLNRLMLHLAYPDLVSAPANGPSRVFVSSAERTFGRFRRWRLLAVPLRTIDIAMRRVVELHTSLLKPKNNTTRRENESPAAEDVADTSQEADLPSEIYKIIALNSTKETARKGALTLDQQKALAEVRTDLDYHNRDVSLALVLHGWEMARQDAITTGRGSAKSDNQTPNNPVLPTALRNPGPSSRRLLRLLAWMRRLLPGVLRRDQCDRLLRAIQRARRHRVTIRSLWSAAGILIVYAGLYSALEFAISSLPPWKSDFGDMAALLECSTVEQYRSIDPPRPSVSDRLLNVAYVLPHFGEPGHADYEAPEQSRTYSVESDMLIIDARSIGTGFRVLRQSNPVRLFRKTKIRPVEAGCAVLRIPVGNATRAESRALTSIYPSKRRYGKREVCLELDTRGTGRVGPIDIATETIAWNVLNDSGEVEIRLDLAADYSGPFHAAVLLPKGKVADPVWLRWENERLSGYTINVEDGLIRVEIDAEQIKSNTVLSWTWSD